MENARLLGELRQPTDEFAELNRGLETRVAEQVEKLGRVGRGLVPASVSRQRGQDGSRPRECYPAQTVRRSPSARSMWRALVPSPAAGRRSEPRSASSPSSLTTSARRIATSPCRSMGLLMLPPGQASRVARRAWQRIAPRTAGRDSSGNRRRAGGPKVSGAQ